MMSVTLVHAYICYFSQIPCVLIMQLNKVNFFYFKSGTHPLFDYTNFF